mmetsp:Transcript_30195/g.46299  ORF Transcript_30195/g.46299 Transcript_30195/m.46299 type:complete len:238 (+) Transcript_30195:1397-2110(+)
MIVRGVFPLLRSYNLLLNTFHPVVQVFECTQRITAHEWYLVEGVLMFVNRRNRYLLYPVVVLVFVFTLATLKLNHLLRSYRHLQEQCLPAVQVFEYIQWRKLFLLHRKHSVEEVSTFVNLRNQYLLYQARVVVLVFECTLAAMSLHPLRQSCRHPQKQYHPAVRVFEYIQLMKLLPWTLLHEKHSVEKVLTFVTLLLTVVPLVGLIRVAMNLHRLLQSYKQILKQCHPVVQVCEYIR